MGGGCNFYFTDEESDSGEQFTGPLNGGSRDLTPGVSDSSHAELSQLPFPTHRLARDLVRTLDAHLLCFFSLIPRSVAFTFPCWPLFWVSTSAESMCYSLSSRLIFRTKWVLVRSKWAQSWTEKGVRSLGTVSATG